MHIIAIPSQRFGARWLELERSGAAHAGHVVYPAANAGNRQLVL